MRLGFTTCTATYGNGAQTRGSMIIHPHPEMTAHTKTEGILIERRAAGRGMNRLKTARSATRLRVLGSEAEEFIGFRVSCDVTS